MVFRVRHNFESVLSQSDMAMDNRPNDISRVSIQVNNSIALFTILEIAMKS